MTFDFRPGEHIAGDHLDIEFLIPLGPRFRGLRPRQRVPRPQGHEVLVFESRLGYIMYHPSSPQLPSKHLRPHTPTHSHPSYSYPMCVLIPNLLTAFL